MTTTKVVHCKKDHYDVYIGRPSKWGNPFPLIKNANKAERERVLKLYEDWLNTQGPLKSQIKRELKGKVLGCWCAPKLCHGDVLARIADEEEREMGNNAS